MKFLLLVVALSAVLSFAWARRYFFVKAESTTRLRRGLGPLGTLFAILLVSSLVSRGGGEGAGYASIALLMFSASLILFWSAVAVFGRRRPLIAFSGVAPIELVTVGPYRHIRHPFYVAYMLFWIAGAIAAPNWVTVPAVGIMGYLYVLAARAEETEMANSPLGAKYEAYKRRTGMFFPRLLRRT